MKDSSSLTEAHMHFTCRISRRVTRGMTVFMLVSAVLLPTGISGCATPLETRPPEPVAVYPTTWPAAIEEFRSQLNPLEAPFEDMRRSYCFMIWATLRADEDLMRGLLAERILDMDEGTSLSREEFLAPLEARHPFGLSDRKWGMVFWDRISGGRLAFFNTDDIRRLNVTSPSGMVDTDYLLLAAPAEGVPQYFFFRKVDEAWLIYAVGQGLPRQDGDSLGTQGSALLEKGESR